MASTYTMVAYGSQSSAVKQLQSELNRRGYSLDEDGIFGKKNKSRRAGLSEEERAAHGGRHRR